MSVTDQQLYAKTYQNTNDGVVVGVVGIVRGAFDNPKEIQDESIIHSNWRQLAP
jgi:uncharacterized protein YcnI